jgi:hypothetical protein
MNEIGDNTRICCKWEYVKWVLCSSRNLKDIVAFLHAKTTTDSSSPNYLALITIRIQKHGSFWFVLASSKGSSFIAYACSLPENVDNF